MKAFLFIAIAAVATGCDGIIGEEEMAGGESEGQKEFNSTISSMLRGQCAACHEGAGSGPAFMGSPGGEDDYTALMSNGRIMGGFQESSALILTKGAHAGVGWWSAEQQSKIKQWLAIEASSNPDAGNISDVMAAWVGCMTFSNFQDSGVGMWADKQTDVGATCGGCHASGEYGFYTNPTREIMFAQMRTQAGINSFWQVSAAGEVVPAHDKLRSKCSGQNLHPACAVDDQYVDYLTRFHSLTRAMQAAGLCSDPGYRLISDPID